MARRRHAPTWETALPPQLTDNQRRAVELLKKGVRKYGSQARFAKICHVAQQTISKMTLTGEVSIEVALRIHKATNGELNRTDLCPILSQLL